MNVLLVEFMYLVAVPLVEFMYLEDVPLVEFMYLEDVPLVEFMYLEFTCMPSESYLHACQVRVTVGDSGLCCCTCYVFRALINSLVC